MSQQQQKKPPRAMVLSASQVLSRIQGTAEDPATVTNRLAIAADRFNLLTPATSVGSLPEGTAVAFTVVYVNPKLMKDGGDCWAMGGGMLMPAKHKVFQFASGLGIDWVESVRVDDRSDPHYCAWRVTGEYLRFDGRRARCIGNKQMDLRDGSPVVDKLRKDAAAKDRSADNQITELRAFIAEHCETKAMLRATRQAAAMKTAWTPAELSKPFVAAQLVVTGRTDDPVMKEMIMRQMLGAGAQAYGPAPVAAQPRCLPAPAPMTYAYEAPPPVGAVALDDDDMYEPPPAQQQQPPPRVVSSPAPPASNGAADDRPLVCPWGDHKGKPWPEVPQDTLMYCLDEFTKALRRNTAKDPERMRRHVAAIEEVLGVPPEEPDPEGQASLPIDDGQY